MAKKTQASGSIYDAIVAEALQQTGALTKSVVVAPADPNGGARLPKRQADQPAAKRRDGLDYMAIFDREADESDEQLDEWMAYTNAVVGSDIATREDDAPADPDAEDARGSDVYDPYSDDEGDEADAEDPVGTYTHVRAHKRRLTKSQGDHDAPDDALSDDEDDEDEDDDAEDKAARVKAAAESEDDDDVDEAPDRAPKRRRSMKKALGRDALDIVDGNAFAKALADAVWDLKDDLVQEIRLTNAALRKQNRALAQRVAAVETNLHKALQGELTAVTKSLATAAVSRAPVGAAPYELGDASQPMRKGYGAPVASQPKLGRPWDWERAYDVLEKAWQTGDDRVKDVDLTILELNQSYQGLSAGAVTVLRKEGLL